MSNQQEKAILPPMEHSQMRTLWTTSCSHYWLWRKWWWRHWKFTRSICKGLHLFSFLKFYFCTL